MRGKAKLADQYNFLARHVDRHHHDNLASDQYIALLRNRWTVLGPYSHAIAMIFAIGFREQLWLR